MLKMMHNIWSLKWRFCAQQQCSAAASLGQVAGFWGMKRWLCRKFCYHEALKTNNIQWIVRNYYYMYLIVSIYIGSWNAFSIACSDIELLSVVHMYISISTDSVILMEEYIHVIVYIYQSLSPFNVFNFMCSLIFFFPHFFFLFLRLVIRDLIVFFSPFDWLCHLASFTAEALKWFSMSGFGF